MVGVSSKATERRLKDDKSCHHGTTNIDAEVAKAAAESEGQDAVEAEKDLPAVIDIESSPELPGTVEKNGTSVIHPPALTDTVQQPEVIEILSDSDSEETTFSQGKKPLAETDSSPTVISPGLPVNPSKKPRLDSQSSLTSVPDLTRRPRPDVWSCPACTLDNSNSDRHCQACDHLQPPPPGFWLCDFCGTLTEQEFRCCRGCGFVRRI